MRSCARGGGGPGAEREARSPDNDVLGGCCGPGRKRRTGSDSCRRERPALQRGKRRGVHRRKRGRRVGGCNETRRELQSIGRGSWKVWVCVLGMRVLRVAWLGDVIITIGNLRTTAHTHTQTSTTRTNTHVHIQGPATLERENGEEKGSNGHRAPPALVLFRNPRTLAAVGVSKFAPCPGPALAAAPIAAGLGRGAPAGWGCATEGAERVWAPNKDTDRNAGSR